MTAAAPPPDSQHRGLITLLPLAARPYALLARFDRPIGWWLLFWPCAFGLALAGGLPERWDLLGWMLIGAIAMRGAGCVYNDIIDRDLDARVARTALRPIASGAVTRRAAAIWMVLLCLIGLVVLLQLPRAAQLAALLSLAPVALYPFMKRITWWPQAWLGLVFSWGALVGWLAIDHGGAALVWLYAGCIAWVIGYDTIYALQDVEDDALVGIRSSALALGPQVKGGVGLFYAAALGAWGMAIWHVRPDPLALAALLPAAIHLTGQVVTLNPADAQDPLTKFRSNRFTGLLIFAAMLVVGRSA
jgi:4-hydroxybenzoate polyprenyltransferase